MRKGSYKVVKIGRIRVYSNISDVCNHTLAISLRVSCGVNRRIVDNTRTRFGFMKLIRTSYITKKTAERGRTLISLCSRNWRMTFLKYSRFMSSSLLAVTGDSGREVLAG